MSSIDVAGLPGMPNDVWPLVHAERRALIDDLAEPRRRRSGRGRHCVADGRSTMSSHTWSTSRRRRGWGSRSTWRWRVSTSTGRTPTVSSGPAGATPQRHAAAPASTVATRTSTPPAPLDTRIVEEVVHGEDIRRVARACSRELSDRRPSSGSLRQQMHACLDDVRRRQGSRRPRPAHRNRPGPVDRRGSRRQCPVARIWRTGRASLGPRHRHSRHR